jgi:predicted transcriptional regulator YdeE
MNTFESITLPAFHIIGITVRTTNKRGEAYNDLRLLWSKFIQKNLAGQIPNKVNDDVLCLYTSYESDHTGPYTAMLGCKVTSLDDIPDGFSGKTIPESKYRVYTSSGRVPDCVMDTWKMIWSSDIPRLYLADFEVYGERANDPDDGVVETYLSIE